MSSENVMKVVIGGDTSDIQSRLKELRAQLAQFQASLSKTKDFKQLTEINKQIAATKLQIRNLESASTKASGTLSNLFAGFGAGIGLGAFAAASSALSSFVSGSINEFQEAERSVNNLRTTLEGIGREDIFDGLIKSSNDLQKQFKYLDNDDITNAFQKLIQVGGLTEDSIRRLMPLIIDLNAKQRLSGQVNKTVADTAEDIAKGLNGQGRELKKYGIELKASNTEAENLSIILGQLPSKVEGASKAFGGSLEGNLAATNARVNELSESLGSKLLPLKAGLLQFANQVADGFSTLIERLRLGSSAFEALKNVKVRVDFVEGKSTEKFDAIKDLPLDELTSELSRYAAAKAKTDAAIKANKSGKETIAQWKLESEVTGLVITKLKELIKVRGDLRTLGTHDEDEDKNHTKVTDAIKTRISALKELIALGIDVSKNSLELKNLDIKLILRDAKASGFTQAEAEKIIQTKYPEFKGGLKLKSPLNVSVDLQIGASIEKSTKVFTGAGEAIERGISATWKGILDTHIRDGEAARAKITEQAEFISSMLAQSFAGIGESLGTAMMGNGGGLAQAAQSFLSVIGDIISQIGIKIIVASKAMAVATKAIQAMLTNPITGAPASIFAGIALIAVGQALKNIKFSAPKFAEGGLVMGPTLGMVGESGPEMVIPLNRANQFIDRSSSGGGEVVYKMHGKELWGVLQRWDESRGRLGG